MTALDWALRLGLAALFSGLVGFEREARQKAAGLRTHMLVGLGAALFGLLSLDAFEAEDRSRIAAQVVSGIGFLGAGVIFRQGANVRGLTTAAGLWAVAAIGLAAGAGRLAGAAAATALVVVILYGLRVIEAVLRHRSELDLAAVTVTLDRVERLASVLAMLGRVDERARRVQVEAEEEGTAVVSFRVPRSKVQVVTILAEGLEGVLEATEADPAATTT